MKTKLLFVVFMVVSLTAVAGTPKEIFDGNETAEWSFGNDAEVRYSAHGAEVEMTLQSNGKYRADMIYRGGGLWIEPVIDKYFALEFYGEAPAANIRVDITPTDGAKVTGPRFQGNKFTVGDKTVVYCDMSDVSGLPADSYEAKMQIVIADNADEPHSYIISSVKFAETLADLGMREPGVTNSTTGVAYANLDAAFKGARSGDVLTVNDDIELTKRLTVPCPLTIKGADKDVKIIRNFTGIMLLVNSETTFSNVTLSGKNDEQSNVLLEVGGVNVTFDNVNFADVSSSKDQGIVYMKKGSARAGKLIAKDVSFINCESVKRPAFIFLGAGGEALLEGKQENVSIAIATAGDLISVSDNFKVTKPIDILFEKVNTSDATFDAAPVAGTKIVEGTRDASLFNLIGVDDLVIKAADGAENALILGKKSVSGINEISIDQNIPAEYFDVMGRRVENPSHGIYIVRQGSKIFKIAL